MVDNGDTNNPVGLDEVLREYAKIDDDARLISEAIEATGTAILLRTLDGGGVVGRTASGRHTFDLAGRQIYFKGVRQADRARLPVTKVHPEYGYIVTWLSGAAFKESKPEPIQPVCPTCFMALPKTGICDSYN